MIKMILLVIATNCMYQAHAMHRESFLPVGDHDQEFMSKISPRNSQKSPDRPLASHAYRQQNLKDTQSIDATLLAAYTNRKISCTDEEQQQR